MKSLTPLMLLALIMTAPIHAAQTPDDLSPILQPILKKSKLPALVAAVVVGDEIRGVGAVGLRKRGDTTPVTSSDKFHLGSCTKSMTATLTAILIEDGLLEWNTTIGEVLGKKIKDIHPQLRDVTVEQLLAHVGGLPAEPPNDTWLQAWNNQGKMTATEQRLRFVSDVLALKPRYKIGSKAVYSNQGYAVAGVMLESLAGKPWEELLRTRLFTPLKMTSAGFRAPCSAGKLDQPWGHQNKRPVPPKPAGDNPSAIAPAGAVHASIADWAKFVRFHLRRETGGILKRKESFDRLHSTLKHSAPLAVGGWATGNMPRVGGYFVQAAGSNTMWFALKWIIPGRNIAVVVATNSAAPNSFTTCDKVVAELLQKYGE